MKISPLPPIINHAMDSIYWSKNIFLIEWVPPNHTILKQIKGFHFTNEKPDIEAGGMRCPRPSTVCQSLDSTAGLCLLVFKILTPRQDCPVVGHRDFILILWLPMTECFFPGREICFSPPEKKFKLFWLWEEKDRKESDHTAPRSCIIQPTKDLVSRKNQLH